MKVLKFFSENWEYILALISLSSIAKYISLYFQVKEMEKANRLNIEADKEIELVKEKNRHQETMATINANTRLASERSKFI